MQFGAKNKLESSRFSYLHPSYSCDLSTDAGAYVVEAGLTLKWDTTSDKWKNATWSENAMNFTYWIEKDGKIGNQQLYQTATVFKDEGEGSTWDVQPRGPGGAGAATSSISPSGLFDFVVNGLYKPPTTGTFPYKMAFQFDQLASSIEGGALLCGKKSNQGKVIAMKGKLDNSFAVGSYSLANNSGRTTKLTTHGRKLVVNGEPLKTSFMSGNKLRWEKLSGGGLPESGHVLFSPDGSRILDSSFGSNGFQDYATGEVGDASDLTLLELLNMNPFGTDSQGKQFEIVQQNCMGDFYKILQYYMPVDYLHNFIAAEPPDLGELKNIADDNDANGPWYSSLAVPYLANALKSADMDSVKKLNARRAQSYLKQATSTSKVFQEQAARLYTHEWVIKFPDMLKFIEDQANNTNSQHDVINSDADLWVARLKKGMDNVDEEEKKQLQEMIDIAENARGQGLNSKYWAYLFFRYICSDGYLTMLRMQMIEGKTSQMVSTNLQRYASVLSVLDPSTFFTKQFLHIMRIQQLTALLPSFFDVGSNIDELSFFLEEIMQAFVKKYIKSSDPAIQKRVRDVEKELNLHSLQEYLNVISEAAVAGGNSAWASLAQRFESAAIQKFGGAAKGVVDLMLYGTISFAIFELATGMISWNQLTPVEKTDFIAGSFLIMTTLIRKGIKAAVAYEATGSLWEAFKVFLYKDVGKLSNEGITSALGRWVTNKAGTIPEESEMFGNLFAEASTTLEEDYPKLVKYLGRSMDEFMVTRFAAALSIVGIVLSALGLADSSTPLDKAMNSMFLLSSILDLVAAVSEWAIAAGVEAIGGLAISTIASFAGPLAIVAAVVGIIILLVEMFTAKKPANPIDTFVKSDAVSNAGYYMPYEASIDYFQIINDKDGKARDIGVAMKPAGSNQYLTANADGTISLGDLSHGYNTVLSVYTDYQGNSYFLTQIWQKKKGSSDEYTMKVVALTLNDNGQLSMSIGVIDDKKKSQQKWTATCTGGVNYESKDHLSSANFTIESVYKKGTYLSFSGDSVTTGTSGTDWTLSMEGMKPERLLCKYIHLYTADKDITFSPNLGQVGSLSNRIWAVNPSLPDFLDFDTTNGNITQKSGQAPPVYAKKDFTITVTNKYGSASAQYSIVVKSL